MPALLLSASGKVVAVDSGTLVLMGGIGSAGSGLESITVSTAAGVLLNSVVHLIGTWFGRAPSAVDYSTDGGATWTAVTNYILGNGVWFGDGPVASSTDGLTIIVRDHNNQNVTGSASLTVVGQAGPGASSIGLAGLPAPFSIAQREPTGTLRSNIPIRFTYGGTPSQVQAKLTRGASTVMDWTDLSNVTAAAGSGFGVLIQAPAGDGDATIAIRDFVGGQQATATITKFGTGGVRGMFAGGASQQLVLTHSSQNSGSDTNALGAYNSSPQLNRIYDGAGWHPLSNSTTYPSGVGQGYLATASAGTLHVTRLVQNALGSVPSSMSPFVRSGTRIEDWIGNGAYKAITYDSGGDGISSAAGFQSDIWTGLNDVPNVGYGDLEFVCWYHGIENADTATATSYGDSLEALYQQFLGWVRPQGRDETSFIFVPVIVHGIASSAANSEYVRKSIMDFVASHQALGHKVSFVSALDIPPEPDGLSIGIDGQVTVGCRQIQALMSQMGLAQIGTGMGPSIVSAARSGTTLTITVQPDGGSSLVTANGGQPTGFYISTDNFASGVGPGTGAYVVPSSVAITDAQTITITGIPSTGTLYLKYQGGTPGTSGFYNGVNNASSNPDVSGAVRDTVPVPTDNLLNVWRAPLSGFPLQPLLTPIVIS